MGLASIITRYRFPWYRQHDRMDCGPTCLRMIAKYYGGEHSLSSLRELCGVGRDGTSFLRLAKAAQAIGMDGEALRVSADHLPHLPLPLIVHWDAKHFVVIYRWSRRFVWIADPARGRRRYPVEDFWQCFAPRAAATESGSRTKATVLTLAPTDAFHRECAENSTSRRWTHFLRYLGPYTQLVSQLALGLFVSVILALFVPFLTQSIVDVGVGNKDLGLIYVLLLAQIMLFAGKTSVQFLRAWILVHIGSRVNVTIVADFLRKLVRLPIPFFQQRAVSDILQRVRDHSRIESFLTQTSLDVLFSGLTLVLYVLILGFYSKFLLLVFAVGSLIGFLWTITFNAKRRYWDQRRFDVMADEYSVLIQLVAGMQEIKLYGAERQRLEDWGAVQSRAFDTRLNTLGLSQRQEGGASAIHELKNILLTFVAARSVVLGEMSLGMMMAVQYIIGQLHMPMSQLVGFVRAYQDASMSLERLLDIHTKADEDGDLIEGGTECVTEKCVTENSLEDDTEYGVEHRSDITAGQNAEREADDRESRSSPVPPRSPILLQDVSYAYHPEASKVLDGVSCEIPSAGVTAIVGGSGSGKTTLLKMLLKIMDPTEGTIWVGRNDLRHIAAGSWRRVCSTVMQDGFVFSDTVARNIALGQESVDVERLKWAARVACIEDFIEELPKGYETLIGSQGQAVSAGQRQRMLIARSVYRNPDFLFFDEATSALDAENERAVISNLNREFARKTVVVVAHRLSTIRTARQILVLEGGRLVERGNHQELIGRRGRYYALVREQLELGR